MRLFKWIPRKTLRSRYSCFLFRREKGNYYHDIVLLSIEKIYQTIKTMFDHIFKHLEGRQKYLLRHASEF